MKLFNPEVARMKGSAFLMAIQTPGNEHLFYDDAKAEDAAQRVSLRLWRKTDSLDSAYVLSTLVGHVVRSELTAMDRGARNRREVNETTYLGSHLWGRESEQPDIYGCSREPMPEDNLEGQEISRAVVMAVKALPTPQSALVSLIYFSGKQVKEAGQILGLSRGVAEKQLHKAKTILRETLSDFR
jgi:RNA polymerase sigma factor (sigma-70 family)